MINSMTKEERLNPKIINASRKQRIARGSGVTVAEVNQLLKQFDDMRGMMKRLAGGGGKTPKGMPGRGGTLPNFPGTAGIAPDALAGLSDMGMPFMGSGSGLSDEAQKKLRQKRKEERQRKKKNRR